MLFKKRFIGTLFTGVALIGCETTSPPPNLDVKPPLFSLNSKKELHPVVAQIFLLLRQEKFSDASTLINQALQAQPKNVTLHLLNGLTYEKLAERGDASGNELAAVGYQNAMNLDPSNVLAITQLGKLKYREQMYDQAEEHFANALLLKPNDAELWQELAAASYYAYDIKTALSAISKAEKLKPNDPLIHRSATMIYASLGDFKAAKKHFEFFKNKAGNDPAVGYVEARLNNWADLYNSGRIKLATTTTTTTTSPETSSVVKPDSGSMTPIPTSPAPSTKDVGVTASTGTPSPTPTNSAVAGPLQTTPPPSTTKTDTTTSSTNNTGGTGVGAGPGVTVVGDSSGTGVASGGGDGEDSSENGMGQAPTGSGPFATTGTPFNIATKNVGQAALTMPFSMTEMAVGDQGEKSKSYDPQIVIDCYLLRITEQAISSKGQNILENLAVTLTPGGYTMFKGNLWGNGTSSTPQDSVTFTEGSGFNANQLNQAGPLGSAQGGAQSAFTPSSTQFNFQNAGSLSGRVFSAGLTWAGLTYSLNIANAIDNRTEVVSRPSLMTFLKKSSVFFSGEELVIGLTGQYGGTLVKYPVGVTLDITPEAIEGDLLTLNVGIEGSLLNSANPSLTATTDVSKTRIDTFIKIRLGQTLMLGGLYERQDISSKNGFPGLQDVPIVQYFFSNESTSSTRRSIVFMLTPRSPDAVKAAVNRAMAREAVEPHLSELISRSPDWFNTHP
ncbi:MAG TPA: hypothetical protein VMW10_05735, partial [Alphaproteobacteria bacterium]|nr:hypothetical protein [Alphaproteobacteria bacterium]